MTIQAKTEMMREKLAATPIPWKMDISMAPLATGTANSKALGEKK